MLALAAAMAAGAPARAEPSRLICRGLTSEPTSRLSTQQGGSFTLVVDEAAGTVLLDGEAARKPVFTDVMLTFTPPSTARNRLSRLLGVFGGKAGAMELNRRNGFWRTKRASGLCRVADASQNLF